MGKVKGILNPMHTRFTAFNIFNLLEPCLQRMQASKVIGRWWTGHCHQLHLEDALWITYVDEALKQGTYTSQLQCHRECLELKVYLACHFCFVETYREVNLYKNGHDQVVMMVKGTYLRSSRRDVILIHEEASKDFIDDFKNRTISTTK